MLTSFTSSTDLPAPRPVAEALPAPAGAAADRRSASSPTTTSVGRPLGPARRAASRPTVGCSRPATSSPPRCSSLGCIGFYWPTLAAGAVTLFLLGSLLFLVSALGSALLDHRR